MMKFRHNHNREILGSMELSGDLRSGANAKVRGSVEVGHNLRVMGFLDAKNIRTPLVGLFASEDDLNKSYPRPRNGWFAFVGNTLPAAVYQAWDKEWLATGEIGGSVSCDIDVYARQIEGLLRDVSELEAELEEMRELHAKLRCLFMGLGVDLGGDGSGNNQGGGNQGGNQGGGQENPGGTTPTVSGVLKIFSSGHGTAPTSDEIQGAAYSRSGSLIYGNHSVACKAGQYLWICIALASGAPSVRITSSGFAVPVQAEKPTVTIQGLTYHCYRLIGKPQSSSIELEIAKV